MRRRDLLKGAAAASAVTAIPLPTPEFTLYLEAGFDRVVKPTLTNLLRPTFVERATDTGDYAYHTSFNISAWRDEIDYSHGRVAPFNGDYDVTHESGHAYAQHLSRWYPGGWLGARRDWLTYHKATIDENDPRLYECFAEHFTAALGQGPFYYFYPAYAGLVPFLSADDSRNWLVLSNKLVEAWCMARMVPIIVPIQVDSAGNTPPTGQLVPGISGLKPGVEAIGVVMRVGFVGTELDIGTFVFVTDTPSQAFGKIHARGAKGGGTVYAMVSAYQ